MAQTTTDVELTGTHHFTLQDLDEPLRAALLALLIPEASAAVRPGPGAGCSSSGVEVTGRSSKTVSYSCQHTNPAAPPLMGRKKLTYEHYREAFQCPDGRSYETRWAELIGEEIIDRCPTDHD